MISTLDISSLLLRISSNELSTDDRHQGLPLRRAAPGPGENQLAVCRHFAKLAADLALFAARGAQHHAITCQGSMTSARANSLARKKNATSTAKNGCSMLG